MNYATVCSGIEAPSVAWEALGWKPIWFSEIDAFPSSLLAHHYPAVKNCGDMLHLARKILSREIPAPDLLCGGTPCQSFSLAGSRLSLKDDRGNLTLAFVELINAIDHIRRADGLEPCIILWENVPGVFSTEDNAFGCFLAALVGEHEPLQPAGEGWSHAGAVYGPKRTAAWRVLDAQYIGLAQRRQRVFVVSSARDGFDPAEILFEFEGVRRNSPPSRETQEDIAGTIVASSGRRRGGGMDLGQLTANENPGPHVPAVTTFDRQSSGEYGTAPIASTMSARDYKSASDLIAVHGTQDPCTADNLAFTLGRNSGAENAIAVSWRGREGGATAELGDDIANTLRASGGGGDKAHALTSTRIRRLTPKECERLQGFPDDYTLTPYRKKPAKDGPRYKALGNSMAVPVIRWIGARIQQFENRRKSA